MSDRTVYLIDYIGNSDKNGNIVGHPLKVLDEYIKLLRNSGINIKFALPHNYRGKIDDADDNILYFKYFIDVTSINKKNKILNTFKKLINLFKLYRNINKDDILWFYNTDFVLGIILSCFNFRNSVWITNYMSNYNFGSKLSNKIKNFYFNKLFNRADKIFTTNKKNRSDKYFYLPDFFYNKDIYEKYTNGDKADQIACVGTMSEEKDLEGIVEISKNLPEYNFIIIGSFFNNERYKKLKMNECSNLKVINKKLDLDQYYKTISESKYIILPYKDEYYAGRSSGILLEAIFLGSMPIAPEFLLDFSGIHGVKYPEIKDVPELLHEASDNYKNMLIQNNKIISEEYYPEKYTGYFSL